MATPPKKGYTKRHQEIAEAAGYESWEAWVAEREREIGFPICGAMTRGKDEGGRRPCGKAAGAGMGPDVDYGPCTWHGAGGANTAGPRHGNYKHGKHSLARYRLRGSLGEVYESAKEEIEDAFDLALHARVLQARIIDLVSNLPKTPLTPASLDSIGSKLDREAVAVLDALDGGGDAERKAAAIESFRSSVVEIRESLSDAKIEADAWAKWDDLVERMRALAQTQGLREQRKHGPVTWGDVLVVVERVRTGILRFVPEESAPEVMDYFRHLSSPPAPFSEPN